MHKNTIIIEYGINSFVEFSNIKFIDDFVEFNLTVKSDKYSGSTIFMSEGDTFDRLLSFAESDYKSLNASVKINKSKYEQDSYIEIKTLDNLGHHEITCNISETDGSQFAKVAFKIDQSVFEKFAMDIKRILMIKSELSD